MSHITIPHPPYLGPRMRALARRVVDSSVTYGTNLYYRYFFCRRLPLGRPMERIIHRWEQGRRGDIPMENAEWDRQYQAGRWAMLRDSRELPRYSVLAGYVHFFYGETPAVLDVGCGEGLLAMRLGGRYRRYVGIDLSRTALEHARSLRDAHAEFVLANAETYAPDGCFDVIVFNESLYYFEQPFTTFQRYARALAPGGSLAVSMYHGSHRARAILRELAARYPLRDRTSIRSGSLTWECCLFSPPSSRH